MNDGKGSAPVNQGQSLGWIAAKFALAIPTLAVVCVGFLAVIEAAINMSYVCPDGMHVGHLPCDASIIFGLFGLLISGLGIWLLRWIGRLEATWNRWRERPPFARTRG